MIKAVLFDIDGVLLDSFEANFRFFQDMLARMGYPNPKRREFRKAFHLPLCLALKHMAKAELIEEMKQLHEIAEEIPRHPELLKEPPHTKEMLDALYTNYKLGIVTSRSRESVSKNYFPFAHTEKYFSVSVTLDDCAHHKPHPGPLLLAAKRLRLPPSDCVYVGDAHTDVEAGRAAGMKTILYGTRKNRNADTTTVSFKELPKLIASLK